MILSVLNCLDSSGYPIIRERGHNRPRPLPDRFPLIIIIIIINYSNGFNLFIKNFLIQVLKYHFYIPIYIYFF